MVDQLAHTEINSQRISAVETCFGAAGQPLTLSGRVLVGEGILTKECRKKPKQRVFFLFSDILVYGTILINKVKYSCQHIIPLEDVSTEKLPDSGDMKNRWMLKTSKKSFVVSAASYTEREEWISHIKECSSRLLAKTGRRPSTKHAAPWIPDKDTEICMRCTKTKFTTLTRRHHCRNCGFVVCHDCSQARFLIPSLSSKPLRVCTLCHRKLMADKKLEEDKKRRYDEILRRMPQYEPSSDEDSDEDRNNDFYSSSWSAFHA
ncbi:pleckstrin homology domain-containing family F member 1 [Bufo gargarizans]|uniref:pleckstrin homology domain-containing family F member 1 n=1 Tax=Bufo gargarizans TaxID=30331 RepID=UPI001CF50454|nr:pleckstrin homology domain-containing family F member 1 [Bufo gargarizans]